jgi:hypothetical protein
MHLYFKTPQGNTVMFETNPDFLPSQLIKALAEEVGIHANSLQCLNGVVLNDTFTIRGWGFEDDDWINVVLAQPSGSEVDSTSRDRLA